MNRAPDQAAAAAQAVDHLAPVRAMVQSCIQCGTCTGSCPNAFAMDLTPRQLWRLVMLDEREAVFQSRTFTLCSACYTCTLRCPRGLHLTEAMHALTQAASRLRLRPQRPVTAFYRNFMDSVRRHGRVNELEFMTYYFAEMKNPLLPLRYSGLGLRLAFKGKLPLHWPLRRKRPLEAVFSRAAELKEGR
jgi:heterodisulfide reductase subunit C